MAFNITLNTFSKESEEFNNRDDVVSKNDFDQTFNNRDHGSDKESLEDFEIDTD
jgi:hypothetical protein